MNLLYIHCNKSLVGTISYEALNKSYSLEYDEDWKNDGFEISPSIGFNNPSNEAVGRFIENLLPEGNGLEELSVYFQISKSEKFSILKQIGLETTGALTFTDSKVFEPNTTFEEITVDELEVKVTTRESNPIHIWNGKPRLSVAGVQTKLPLTILTEKFGFGEGDICSTHILKFNRVGENVVTNEFISMKLALAMGYNVAEVACAELANECVLFVTRFDREIINDELIERKHIIDSVQALGFPISYKYERNLGINMPNYREGVSFSKLFSLANKAIVPALFKEQVIKWSILNIILGNSDAHGKNISFFVSKEGLEVAPFYDLVNVTMYQDKYEQDMAMAIEDVFQFDSLNELSFREFFDENNISTEFYFNEFKSSAMKLKRAFKDMAFLDDNDFVKKNEDFILKYIENVKNRVNFISDLLNSVRYLMPLEDQTHGEFFKESIRDIKKLLGKEYSAVDTPDNIVKKYISKVTGNFIVKL
ncbi:type II toxin-antitoxin system HipA family toxin [Sulfurimonas aquatica]|uniref:Type II toxin-antitoxin system HipA family toxin n=1 Tax=Sulfurimonas aquatica TaxID=2672570 RepID=A0A975B255_9BACT|nr:HipA domain-containing protein [Sulfurimonas aquatica]QSZ42851.1 type II toxin-antitoxin system HipA family toxin [Sulfurimonas aquatica]